MGEAVKFAIHKTLPARTPAPRRGRFAEAIRYLVKHPSHNVSFPHGNNPKTKAALRVGFGNAARSLGVNIKTTTSDTGIHAFIVEGMDINAHAQQAH